MAAATLTVGKTLGSQPGDKLGATAEGRILDGVCRHRNLPVRGEGTTGSVHGHGGWLYVCGEEWLVPSETLPG